MYSPGEQLGGKEGGIYSQGEQLAPYPNHFILKISRMLYFHHDPILFLSST